MASTPYTHKAWETGDIINKEKLNAIGKSLQFASQQLSNAIKDSSSNNTGLKTRLDKMILISNTQPDIGEYDKLWINTNSDTEQQLVTLNDFLQDVKLYTKATAYSKDDYIIANGKIYKVKEDIAGTEHTQFSQISNKCEHFVLAKRVEDVLKNNEQFIIISSESLEEIKTKYPNNKLVLNPNITNEPEQILTKKELENIIAKEFNNATNYVKGDYVIYTDEINGKNTSKLYQFITNHNAGSWNPLQVIEVNIDTLIQRLYQTIDNYQLILKIYEQLIANNEYSFTKEDFEQGGWAYTHKDTRTSALRCKVLIPVRKGMQIKYTVNNALKIRLGILSNTHNSTTYNDNLSNWLTGVNAFYSISQSGFLMMMIGSDNDKQIVTLNDFNCNITIYSKQQENQVPKLYGINTQKVLFNILGGISASNLGFWGTPTRIQTGPIKFAKGIYHIKVPNDYGIFIAKQGVLEGGILSNEFIFDAEEDEQINFVSRDKNDGSKILTVTPPVIGLIERYSLEELTEEKLNGVGTFQPTHQIAYLKLNNANTLLINKIYKMPLSGINIERFRETNGTTSIACMFYHLIDNILVPATDYEYTNIEWNTQNLLAWTSGSIYYPYMENLYFTIIFHQNQSIPKNVFVSYGTVKNGNGRLTFLSPATLIWDSNTRFCEPTLNISASYNTSQYFYGSLIRLKDAKAICCSANLSMAYWIYTNEHKLIDWFFGPSLLKDGLQITGKNYIDLSQYGDQGYCFIAIRKAPKFQVSTDTNTPALSYEPLGGVYSYDYILNNVFVQYYNNVIINRKLGMNHILAHNIEKFKTIDCGKAFAYSYRGPVTANACKLDEQEHTALYYYAATVMYNGIFRNVSLKSYVTALQNPNSQIYLVGQGEEDSKRYSGFGTTCSGLPAILFGFDWVASFAFLPGDKPEDYEDFEYYKDWSCTEQPQALQIGDWVIWKQDDVVENGEEIQRHDGHVILVTDKIYVNGELIGYEGMDAAPPYVRYIPLFIYEPFRFFTQSLRLANLDNYHYYARLKDWSKIRTLEDAYGDLSTDYTVGTLMCDRGTDSVYGIGQSHCYITIADEAIRNIKIYKNGQGQPVATYQLPPDNERITFSDYNFGQKPYKAVDIMEIIRQNGPGYYQLIPDNQINVQESFYVGGVKTIEYDDTSSQDTVTITMESPDDIAYVMVTYNQEDYSREAGKTSRFRIGYTRDMIINNQLTVPRQATYFTGHTYTFHFAKVLYYAKYDGKKLGTYYVLNNQRGDHNVYVASDGSLNSVDPNNNNNRQ